MRKKFYFIAVLALGALSMSVALNTESSNAITELNNVSYKNLKVLPEDISKKELGAIMREFNKALGVKCNFCHAPKKEGKGLDFASDEKREKHITRGMMMMTKGINEEYFYKYQESEVKVPKVSCMTCHNKKKKPKV